MLIEIIEDPKAAYKINLIRSVLLQIKKDIDHTVETLGKAEDFQDQNALEAVADFLGTDPAMISIL